MSISSFCIQHSKLARICLSPGVLSCPSLVSRPRHELIITNGCLAWLSRSLIVGLFVRGSVIDAIQPTRCQTAVECFTAHYVLVPCDQFPTTCSSLSSFGPIWSHAWLSSQAVRLRHYQAHVKTPMTVGPSEVSAAICLATAAAWFNSRKHIYIGLLQPALRQATDFMLAAGKIVFWHEHEKF